MHELNDTRARHIAKYESLVEDLDHDVDVIETEDGETRVPKHIFEYWLDYISAAVKAGWFKHLTQEQVEDMEPAELRQTFKQVDERYIEMLQAAFADPN